MNHSPGSGESSGYDATDPHTTGVGLTEAGAEESFDLFPVLEAADVSPQLDAFNAPFSGLETSPNDARRKQILISYVALNILANEHFTAAMKPRLPFSIEKEPYSYVLWDKERRNNFSIYSDNNGELRFQFSLPNKVFRSSLRHPEQKRFKLFVECLDGPDLCQMEKWLNSYIRCFTESSSIDTTTPGSVFLTHDCIVDGRVVRGMLVITHLYKFPDGSDKCTVFVPFSEYLANLNGEG